MESKEGTPSVMAKLMGLNEMPPQKPIFTCRRVLSDNYLQKTASIGLLHKRSYHEGCPSMVDIEMQQEYKDAFEVPETPKKNLPFMLSASEKRAKSRASKSGIDFLRQRFADAEPLSVDEDIKHSEGSDVDSNYLKNLLFSYQPNSLFVKNLIDVRCVQLHPLSGQVIGAPNGLSNGSSKVCGQTGKVPSREKLRSLKKLQNGFLTNFYGDSDANCFELGCHLELKDKKIDPPTRIVVLKPNVYKTKEAVNFGSSCSVLQFYATGRKNKELLGSTDGKSYNKAKEREKSAQNLKHSWHSFRASRAVAREIKQQIRRSIHKDVSGSNFCVDKTYKNESQVTPRRGFFDWRNKKPTSPDSSPSESKEVEEAKRNCTLGEMLAMPDQGTVQKSLNCKLDEYGSSSEFVLNQGNTCLCSPQGISSMDGWKVECSGKLPRSRALPVCNFGSLNSRTRSEAFHGRWNLSPGEAKQSFSNKDKLKKFDKRLSFMNFQSAFFKSENNQTWQEKHDSLDDNKILNEVKGKLDNEIVVLLELSSCTVPCLKPGEESMVIQDTMEVSSEKNDEFDDYEVNSIMDSSIGSFNTAITISDILADGDDVEIIGPDSVRVPSGLTKEQESQPVPCLHLEKNGPYFQLQESSAEKELPIGFPKGGDPWNDSRVNLDYSKHDGEACHASPNSVLELPFDEENSSGSECCGSICGDLYGLRMQLQPFQSESEDTRSGQPSMSTSSDENMEDGSINFSEEKTKLMGLFRSEASMEFSYLVDVLDEVGFHGINLEVHFDKWHAQKHLLSPLVFEALEKKYGKRESWDKSDRRLLFDRINSGLMEILRPYMDISMGSIPLKKNFSATMRRDVIEEQLWKMLACEAKEVSNDKAVGKEIGWLHVAEDLYSIAKELEEFLFSELVAELGSVESL